METWTIHSNPLSHRREHGANSITIEAWPETMVSIRRYIRGSYQRALRSYIGRARQQWSNLSALELLLIWRQSPRSIIWDTAFAMHLAKSSTFTSYLEEVA